MKTVKCVNSSKDSKYFTGKLCNNVINVSETAEKALCWACLVRSMGNPTPVNNVKRNIGFPRGWKFMTEFVDKDGNVYHKGIEQVELKNTLPPTKVIKKQKPKKKTPVVNFEKIKQLKKKIKDEKDLRKKRILQRRLDKYLQEL